MPATAALKVVPANVGVAMDPTLGDKMLQRPMPSVGVAAAMVTVGAPIQATWLPPATAITVPVVTSINNVSMLEAQTPLLMLQVRVLVPALNPITPLLLPDGTVTVPVPFSTVQLPLDTEGKFAFRAVEGDEIQINWSFPARAVVGTLSTCMLMVAELEQPPFVIVHAMTLLPRLRPVTVVVSELTLVMVPAPVVTDQLPMPTVGVLPEIVALGELIQTV